MGRQLLALAWAQNLTFERQRLLKKLNKILPTPLVDIRFSTARWQRTKKNHLRNKIFHRSRIPVTWEISLTQTRIFTPYQKILRLLLLIGPKP
ncbi:MAG: hypothetical protein HC917_24425 [Richelia sp. SM2_1_7]|nr:hypothetical protein [Richelia sp. SM2_1_7]